MTKSSLIALFVLAIIIISLLFLQTPLMRPIRDKAWTGWTKTVARILNIGPLELDQATENQLHRLQSENIRLKAELQDYTRLRQQLGTPAFDDFKTVNAAVIGRPIDTLRSQYVINKGTNDGLVPEAPVVINGSTMIGYIADLKQKTAVVQLLFHPATNLTVETLETDDDSSVGRGLLQGKHYTSLVVTNIPRNVSIRINQPVVTVTKENQIPHGLTIGTIAKIHNEENETYQEAWLALPYDPDKIDAVGVLISP